MTDLDLYPTVLPYHNVLTGERGWQFALPGAPIPSGGKAPPDIFILLEDGTSRRIKGPIFTPADPSINKPAMPIWAWVPTQDAEIFGYDVGKLRRVQAPTAGPGRCPLHQQTLLPRPFPDEDGFRTAYMFVTPAGDERFGMPARAQGHEFNSIPADLPYDVMLPVEAGTSELTMIEIKAGGSDVARLWVEGDYLLAVEPHKFAAASGLWTTHIVAFAMANLST